MPRVSQDIKQNENRSQVAKLIRDALIKGGLTKKRIAESAGITPSHFSQVLAKEKSLGREKLIALAQVLNIPYEKILSVAGFPLSDLKEIELVESVIAKPANIPAVTVITDPRFVDSLIFMWMFSLQPFRALGIDCELRAVDWRSVPEEVAGSKYAIGFYNRKSTVRINEEAFLKTHYWMDLCLYRGYALLARKTKDEQQPQNIDQTNTYLERHIAKTKGTSKKPVIIAMGADTLWRLENPLNPLLTKEHFTVESYDDADFALRQFLSGVGDYFVGGLPQRLAAREADCIEVVNSQINPLLFSLNSLICSDVMVKEHTSLLTTASALWFETTTRLKSDNELRARLIETFPALMKDLRRGNYSLTETTVIECLRQDSPYEVFPEHPTDLLDELVSTITKAFNQITDPTQITDMLDSLHFTLSRELIRST